MREEGMGIDVVSSGEIATALEEAAGEEAEEIEDALDEYLDEIMDEMDALEDSDYGENWD